MKAMSTLRQHLPQGQLLPEQVWRRRHAWIVAVLWAHALALPAFGLFQGYEPVHTLLEGSVLMAAALLAGWERAGLKLRMVAASFGLVSSSALLVHLSGGLIEAHFHFFVMIGVLTLYQDWLPFMMAIGYVVVHHGVGGAIAPAAVFNHPDAVANPWKWALIHAAFVLAASAANVVAWRTNETQLLRDPLTGLPSRMLFLNRVSVALARLRRQGGSVAVLFLDLDRFKVINDSLGHSAGDALIVGVAERLRVSLRRHEIVSRFGGDEFVILCEGVTDAQDAVAVAERVLKSFGLPFSLKHGDAFTSASIGIAVTADPDHDVEELVRDADAAMYRGKEQGGGRHLLFDDVTRARALHRLETESALRRALEWGEFRVFFQPEVTIDSNEIVGLEALVRWQHPERGLVLPGEFIPMAEETGLIVPLGTWVLAESCRLAQRWQAAGPAGSPLVLRVNVSARQLAEPQLPDIVAGILARSGIDPAQLCLEVTESILMEDADSSLAALEALKALGVQIAIDDFGTGYSSLSYLKRFPVDSLKIDRSFVRDLDHGAGDSAIVAAVVDMAHALSLSVTAEGVETGEQLAQLRVHECDTAQGFLFAHPEPPEVIDRMLSSEPAAALAKAATDESGA